MLTKKLADSIEITLSAFSEYNASFEEDAAPSKLNEDFIESNLCRFDKEIFLRWVRIFANWLWTPVRRAGFFVI